MGLVWMMLYCLIWHGQSNLHFLVLMQQHCHSLHPGGTFNMQKVFLRSRNMVLLSWGKLKLPLGPPPMLCAEKSEHCQQNAEPSIIFTRGNLILKIPSGILATLHFYANTSIKAGQPVLDPFHMLIGTDEFVPGGTGGLVR